jgi:hypothetical protein
MEQDFNKYFSPNQPYSSKVYNTNQTHPLIPSSQEYLFYKKYVSINSQDRDILKYPNASCFEIELPEDLLNVSTISLTNWSFPDCYDVFSQINSNVTMSFKINKPYNNLNINAQDYYYYYAIYCALMVNIDYNYSITIEQGSYTPEQIACELTRKFNYAVTQIIKQFFEDTTSPNYYPQYADYLLKLESEGYTNFKIVYNKVDQKIWFGNVCDGFILTSETLLNDKSSDTQQCYAKYQLPNYSYWGLPFYLGLPKTNVESVSISSFDNSDAGGKPRFFYGDVLPGDNGYWLSPNPNFTDSEVYWVEPFFKLNIKGPSYFFIELDGQNCIDETMPYNQSIFTLQTNQTNGIVNSCFAKVAIPTPEAIPTWYDRISYPYKEYNPPAERIRKLKFRIRYHNGQLVDFGNLDYSLLLEFVILQPTPARTYTNSFKKPNMISK